MCLGTLFACKPYFSTLSSQLLRRFRARRCGDRRLRDRRGQIRSAFGDVRRVPEERSHLHCEQCPAKSCDSVVGGHLEQVLPGDVQVSREPGRLSQATLHAFRLFSEAQLRALMRRSERCEQSIRYECFGAPLE